MTETKPTYQVTQDFAVAKNYSLTMLHIGKVADMAARLQVSQGEIVRRAIDMLWTSLQNGAEPQA